MDDADKAVAVAMAALVVVKVQAAAEPVASGPDTSNPKRAGRATSDKVGKQTPTHTSYHVHQT